MTAPTYTVSAFTELMRDTVAARPEFEDVLVEGEISNLSTPSSGHIYFTLKDGGAAIGCVSFRSHALRIPFAPENGMTVIAHGHVEIYAQQGRYQLYVDRLEPSGVGALALAVEQRRRSLAAAGLFDDARKRQLPLLPRRVVVVTSRTGAALRDVATVLGRRAPCVDLVLSPATVQGDGAVETIVLALRRAARVRGAELILLVRGGGSFEDLMAFNDEAVVRAVHACPIPVVSGIGHQSDSTLVDLVADRRAPTPSAAAEMAVPSCVTLRADLGSRELRLRQGLRAELAQKRLQAQRGRSRLEQLSPVRLIARLRQDVAARQVRLRSGLVADVASKQRALDRRRSSLALESPLQRLPVQRERLVRQQQRLDIAVRRFQETRRRELAGRARLPADVMHLVNDRRQHLHGLSGRLGALSPLRVLERGYSITAREPGGQVITTAAEVAPGMRLRTRLAGGVVISEVVETLPAERMYDQGVHQVSGDEARR